jgi:alkylation response protein AidB-like acyl-CoA dehydrogenase
MPTGTTALNSSELGDVEALLTAESLSALMRSTWTWDDRALRRDLSTVLVQLDAARLVGQSDTGDEAVGTALRAQACAHAARFVAAVLGPKLIADTGNPLRQHFLALASDPAQFGRQAHAARRDALAHADMYFGARIDGLDFAPPAAWADLVTANGVVGLGTAMRCYGHELSDTPLFASMALAWQAASLVERCDIAKNYADRLRSGEIVGTLAAAEQTGSWDPSLVRTRATCESGQWLLSGEKNYVPAADAANVVFVIARSIAGPSLFAIDAGAHGLGIAAHPVLDDTRPLFGVTLTDTPAALVGTEGSGGRLMSRLIDVATTALAAEQVGLVEAAIGTLRAEPIPQDDRIAELVLNHVAAQALWQRALNEPTPASAAAAHIGCSAAAVRAATIVAELRDDELTTSLLRRALSGSLLFGGPALAHERLLDRLGI